VEGKDERRHERGELGDDNDGRGDRREMNGAMTGENEDEGAAL
jgi:hypothetical protein